MKLALESGISMAAGTDFAGIDTEPHGQNYVELVHLAHSGMKPLDVLRASTSGGAKCLGLERTGVIEEGATADIIAVGGKPQESPKYLSPENVEIVVWHGRVVRKR